MFALGVDMLGDGGVAEEPSGEEEAWNACGMREREVGGATPAEDGLKDGAVASSPVDEGGSGEGARYAGGSGGGCWYPLVAIRGAAWRWTWWVGEGAVSRSKVCVLAEVVLLVAKAAFISSAETAPRFGLP